MTIILYGERISRQGKLRLGCSAVLFNEIRSMVLLTLRRDNGKWCLPGGMINAGESVSEGCEREILEETGLQVRVIRLTGIYSDPNQVVVYPDGNKAHIVVLNFEVELLGGEIQLSDETSSIEWFTIAQALEMDLFHGHTTHILDTCVGSAAAIIR
jgi:ADP-ribose pyrophosphatase YjhB (NUDIX family)